MNQQDARLAAARFLATLTPQQKAALLRKIVAHEVAKMVRMEVVTPLRQMLKHYVTEMPDAEEE